MSEAKSMQQWEDVEQGSSIDEPKSEWEKVLEYFGYETNQQFSHKQRTDMLWNYRTFGAER